MPAGGRVVGAAPEPHYHIYTPATLFPYGIQRQELLLLILSAGESTREGDFLVIAVSIHRNVSTCSVGRNDD
ncbi:hypothetical protein E2C01_043162 [Portunus trituberculatus]|uniref:Uncharacterized protein n=1 Tax=Portunus trituberculatus TaxID=210409 RepID=A0A5B7FWJ2_PORTR|nr:hypothetical protein [Portunus trituberculatus]